MKLMNHRIWKTLGPGILFASTAIGVSHLVQSTRAGAVYGFGLLWAVVLANLMKYPFFEFGSRYANSTGTSIIDGYKKLGKGVLIGYVLITLASMFFVSAAVTAVTGGFLDNLLGLGERIGWSYSSIAGGLLLVCVVLLSIGRYNLLDSLVKIIASVLLITTVIAFGLTLFHGPVADSQDWFPVVLDTEIGIAFLIALMGWMPTAVDLSAWNSLWTVERIKQSGYRPLMKETLFDFNLGYISSAVLALFFMCMGAFLFYGTGVELSSKASSFAHQVISMYTATIGDWSYLIVASAGFAIMFGTCIAVLDGYARAMDRAVHLLFDKEEGAKKGSTYSYTLWILAIGSFSIIYFMGSSIPYLVDLATTISFVIAPLIATVNLILVQQPHVHKEDVPPKWLLYLAYCGLVFLIGFCILFMIQ